MSGKMGTKFCFGNSPISSGYAIGYFGIAIRLFLIPNLIALASYHVTKMHKIKEDGEAESEAESDAEPEGEAENGTGIHFDKVILTLLGLGLIKINDVSANFNNPRPSLILNN